MSELEAIAAATDEQVAAWVERRREACVLAGVSEGEAMFFRHIDALRAELARVVTPESFFPDAPLQPIRVEGAGAVARAIDDALRAERAGSPERIAKLRALIAGWRNHRPTREELEEAANAVPSLLDLVERLTNERAASSPCPGIEIEPGVTSGCAGGLDCPTCCGGIPERHKPALRELYAEVEKLRPLVGAVRPLLSAVVRLVRDWPAPSVLVRGMTEERARAFANTHGQAITDGYTKVCDALGAVEAK
jgi:uncharacterized protein YjiS (DUF1127 family)